MAMKCVWTTNQDQASNVEPRARQRSAIAGLLGAALLLVSAVALAGEWHLVGDVVYKDSDNEWAAWISDGDGNHFTVRGGSKKATRKKAEEIAAQLNSEGCVDPCFFDREGCGGAPAAASRGGGAFVAVSATQNPDGSFTARFHNATAQGGAAVRSTAAAANTAVEGVVEDLNAGQCAAFGP